MPAPHFSLSIISIWLCEPCVASGFDFSKDADNLGFLDVNLHICKCWLKVLKTLSKLNRANLSMGHSPWGCSLLLWYRPWFPDGSSWRGKAREPGLSQALDKYLLNEIQGAGRLFLDRRKWRALI